MSEEEKVIEFYDDICKDIAKSNSEALIEGFIEFKSPALSKACKWTNVAVSGLENAGNLETILTAGENYAEAKTQERKNEVVAKNLSATLNVMSFVTSISDITSCFSAMFSIAAKCLDKGFEIVNKRVNDLEAYYEAIEGCSVNGNYGELKNSTDKISGVEADLASAQELLASLNRVISAANRLTGNMKINTSEVSKKISAMDSKINSLSQKKYEIINNLNNKTGEQFMSLADIEKSYLGEISDKTNGAEKVKVDPLILDLSGDGFNIEKKKSGTYFDLNCNGFAERINWTRSDAILSLDKNNNGKIDDGSEVFGDYHLLANGTRAKNGFEALAQYDSNGDGVIDANDEIFDSLKLWVDADGDGVSEAGELKTLKEMHIKAIHLNYQYVNEATGTEALIGNVATFEYENGTESKFDAA